MTFWCAPAGVASCKVRAQSRHEQGLRCACVAYLPMLVSMESARGLRPRNMNRLVYFGNNIPNRLPDIFPIGIVIGVDMVWVFCCVLIHKIPCAFGSTNFVLRLPWLRNYTRTRLMSDSSSEPGSYKIFVRFNLVLQSCTPQTPRTRLDYTFLTTVFYRFRSTTYQLNKRNYNSVFLITYK